MFPLESINKDYFFFVIHIFIISFTIYFLVISFVVYLLPK